MRIIYFFTFYDNSIFCQIIIQVLFTNLLGDAITFPIFGFRI